MFSLQNQIKQLDIRLLILSAIAFWMVSPDFTIPSTDYDAYQFYQFRSLCVRALSGFVALGIMSVFVDRQKILSAVVFAIALAGAFQAVLSLMQLMGITRSHHAIFRLTGSFYNPGPLGGYLAACNAVTIAYFIKHKFYKPDTEHVAKWFLGSAALLMTMVLPATFSRTAWIALVVALAYIVFACTDVRNFIRQNLRNVLLVCLVVFVLIAAVFVKKSVSASGRFLVWKISAIAAIEKPMTGHGNFEVAYCDASEKYFAQNNWTDAEFRAVDYVDNSFNEYLFLAIKHGIPAAVLLVAIMAIALFVAHKKGRIEYAAGIIAIAVFAVASYPLHLADFVALLFVCIAASFVPEKEKISISIVSACIAVVSAFGIKHYNAEVEKIELLAKPDAYYMNKAYSTSSFFYEELYPKMADNHVYMYNMAYSFYKNGDYDKAKKYFGEVIEISGNPNAFKYLGKIYLYEKDFVNAEKYLKRAINILPNRVEPYELLIELYSTDIYKNEKKLTELNHFVSTHRFKY